MSFISLEHKIQSSFFAVLALNEKKFPALKWVHAIPNASGVGGVQGAILGAKFKREGRKSGILDTFFPFFNGQFHGLFIEFKTGKNKPSREQNEFERFALSQNFDTAICYSADEGLAEIEKYTGWKLIK